MSNSKNTETAGKPKAPQHSPHGDPQQGKKQSGDPDNKSDTTGATEAGDEDIGAKS